MDARNFTDPSTVSRVSQESIRRHHRRSRQERQTFFFFNYEGIQLVQGFSQIATVPLARASTATNPAYGGGGQRRAGSLSRAPRSTSTLRLGPGRRPWSQNPTHSRKLLSGALRLQLSPTKIPSLGDTSSTCRTPSIPSAAETLAYGRRIDIGANQFFNLEERHIFSPTRSQPGCALLSRVRMSTALREPPIRAADVPRSRPAGCHHHVGQRRHHHRHGRSRASARQAKFRTAFQKATTSPGPRAPTASDSAPLSTAFSPHVFGPMTKANPAGPSAAFPCSWPEPPAHLREFSDAPANYPDPRLPRNRFRGLRPGRLEGHPQTLLEPRACATNP